MFNLLLLATFSKLAKLLLDALDLLKRLVRFREVGPEFVDLWLEGALLLLLEICVRLLNVLLCVLTWFYPSIEVETFVAMSHSVVRGLVIESHGPERRFRIELLLLLDALRLIALLLCHELLLAEQLVRNLQPRRLHLLPALLRVLLCLLRELHLL